MSLVQLHQDASFQIHFDETENWLCVDWIGCQTTESVQRGCERILELMRQHQVFHILNDNSHVLGLWLGASGWVAQDWMPRAVQAGLDRLAWIYGPSPFSRVSTDATLALIDSHDFEAASIKMFHDIEAARSWLRTATSD